jgi:hypothetical protein
VNFKIAKKNLKMGDSALSKSKVAAFSRAKFTYYVVMGI